jgi:sulfite reductase beta subunit-like hemoprotein
MKKWLACICRPLARASQTELLAASPLSAAKGTSAERSQVPNGELTSEQLRFLGESIAPYGEDGCADITTRANIQVG